MLNKVKIIVVVYAVLPFCCTFVQAFYKIFFIIMDKRKLVALFIVEQGMVIGLVLGVAIGYKIGQVKMGVVYGLLGGAVLGGIMSLLASSLRKRK